MSQHVGTFMEPYTAEICRMSSKLVTFVSSTTAQHHSDDKEGLLETGTGLRIHHSPNEKPVDEAPRSQEGSSRGQAPGRREEELTRARQRSRGSRINKPTQGSGSLYGAIETMLLFKKYVRQIAEAVVPLA
jgi:hypothetical protein